MDLDLDVILDEIGEFGRYQKVKYFLLCIPVFFGAANSLSYVFTAGAQHYRCIIPECESTTEYSHNWLSLAIPGEYQNDGTYEIDHCKRFVSIIKKNSSVAIETCFLENFISNQTEECNEFVFDRSSSLTIAEKFNITCKRNDWKLPLVGTAHFLGVIVGTLWMSFGDYFGRKITLILATIFMCLTGIGQAFSTSYEMFLIFAFLNAVGVSGLYPMAFVLGLEMVGKKKRGDAGIICNYFYSLGVAVLGALAWIFKDYVHLQLLISIPPLITVGYYWIIPESVRWLITKKRYQEAISIIRKVAKVNGTVISKDTNETFQKYESMTEDEVNAYDQKVETLSIWNSVKLMMSKPIMWLRVAILLYSFAINALVYFSLSLNSVSLSGNKFFNFILVSLVEIPGYMIGLKLINKYGRIPGYITSMIICGVTCILCGYVDTVWIQILFFLVGKLGITSSFSIIYVHAAEMMPTVIRSSTLGLFSTMSRVGALASPFAPMLAEIYQPLPYIFFGSTALLGALIYIFLPETLNRKLPNTVEEATKINFTETVELPILPSQEGQTVNLLKKSISD